MVTFCDCCFYSDSPEDAEPCKGCGCMGLPYVEWVGLWDAEGNEIAPPTAYDYDGNPLLSIG